jgi:outer membrane biogenesis lipoprotein LolB
VTGRTLLACVAVLVGCGGECSDFPDRPAQLLTTGDYQFQPSALQSSFPSVNAQGPVAVSVNREAGTVRMRWTRSDGAVTEETWRLRN